MSMISARSRHGETARRRPAGAPVAAMEPCEACEGHGAVVGADFGAVGMVEDDGTPIRIPCIVCDGTGRLPRVQHGREAGRRSGVTA